MFLAGGFLVGVRDVTSDEEEREERRLAVREDRWGKSQGVASSHKVFWNSV